MKKLALLSVSNKSGIVAFADTLVDLGYEILSTGGTAKLLEKYRIPVTLVSEYTGHPEILGGRVKTLHPKIHAGILAQDDPVSKSCMEKHGYRYIDIVAVNLYPFQETIAKEGVVIAEAVENIDIGGPTMLRAAAKNFDRVIVTCNPANYITILDHLKTSGEVPYEVRKYLAYNVFEHTAAYDREISHYLLKIN